jgi:hypothetical protein
MQANINFWIRILPADGRCAASASTETSTYRRFVGSSQASRQPAAVYVFVVMAPEVQGRAGILIIVGHKPLSAISVAILTRSIHLVGAAK